MSRTERKAPWQEQRERIMEALRNKLSGACGVTVIDPFVTVRFTDPESGQFMTVSMVASDVTVQVAEPECPKGDEKAAKARREKVRLARVTDDWASPSGPLGWLCPQSPNGYCWYDDEVDPLNDHCLGCGHPSERK